MPLTSEWSVQGIESAFGNVVNMDYFPVTIGRMPTVDGKKLSPFEFFEHVRRYLNHFISFMGVKFMNMNEVLRDDPRFKGETELWKSDNPFLALLSITIPFNNGSVICSDYDTDFILIGKSNWKFTTIKGTVDGDHPVSGN